MVAKKVKDNIESLDEKRKGRDKTVTSVSQNKFLGLNKNYSGSELEEKTDEIYNQEIAVKKYSGEIFQTQHKIQEFFYEAAVDAKDKISRYEEEIYDLEDILELIPEKIEKITQNYSNGNLVVDDSEHLVLFGWADPIEGSDKAMLNTKAMEVAKNYKDYVDTLEEKEVAYNRLLTDLKANF